MIHDLILKYGIKAKKNLGQNFLMNTEILSDIASSADLTSNDRVVEIGPGFGILTRELLDRAGFVVAVEYDKDMLPILQDVFQDEKRLIVVGENILDISNRSLCQMFGSPVVDDYKVVANIPYNITSLLMRKFTEQKPTPTLCVFLVQKEVAERICAKPGALSVLGIAVQFYMNTEYLFDVSSKEFYPAPKVDSAVIRLFPNSQYIDALFSFGLDSSMFFRVVKIGFSSKRKQLHNNLSAGLRQSSTIMKNVLRDLGLNENIRAQELSIDDWIALTKSLHKASYMI